MNHVFYGFSISTAYGVISGIAVWQIDGVTALAEYLNSYYISFNNAIVGGVTISTSILIFKTQKFIPDLIDSKFPDKELKSTEYTEQKRRFFSTARSISFSFTFVAVGFLIFLLACFPLDGAGHFFLLAFGCSQYGLGVYVGRKLFYIAQMLHSIGEIEIKKDIFSNDDLGMIPVYVNSLSTLTAIFVFVDVHSYYNAPFLYCTIIGETAKAALLLPAILAIPVICLFNFYPRAVLRVLYSRSINFKIDELRKEISNQNISEYEKLAYIIEYDRISTDELKHRLRMTISDLPMAATIILMILSVVFN
jgi:hypothetical protein